jgi:hypothetical protein
MKKFLSILTNGQILSVGLCTDDDLEKQPGYPDSILEVDFDSNVSWDTHYVENGQVFEMPTKPDGQYSFDYTTKTWQQNSEKQEQDIKMDRNYLLTSSDWTQIPNNPLTTELQQQWAIYRQELRDIPQQSGYPFNVIWPTPPQG